jgi:hypothetical protein
LDYESLRTAINVSAAHIEHRIYFNMCGMETTISAAPAAAEAVSSRRAKDRHVALCGRHGSPAANPLAQAPPP